MTSSDAGLRFWRNDGGNQNLLLKLRLVGNRSNTTSLGVRVEVLAGDWRTSRTVRRIPLEIGVGRHTQLDALKVHWFDLSTAKVDVPVGRDVYTVTEPTLPSGSCPYLYAWDGAGFRFVTDILGAAPLGLPQNEHRYVPADSEELLALGDETKFPPRNGAYEIRITDELREVLYLDEARLIAVDHPRGTVVYPTSKMHAAPPFPPHELWTLRPLATPRHAVRSDGLDVTAALARVDNQMVSPVRLRRPQLRGLAEPFSVTLDFGPLPVKRPLVLALTGWLHFGGGMANIVGVTGSDAAVPLPRARGGARGRNLAEGGRRGRNARRQDQDHPRRPGEQAARRARSDSGCPRPSRSTGIARCCARRPGRRTPATTTCSPNAPTCTGAATAATPTCRRHFPSRRSTGRSRRRPRGTGRPPAGSPDTARSGISWRGATTGWCCSTAATSWRCRSTPRGCRRRRRA